MSVGGRGEVCVCLVPMLNDPAGLAVSNSADITLIHCAGRAKKEKLKAEVYRGCGNELRKHKQYKEAVSYLGQSLYLYPDVITIVHATALLVRPIGLIETCENLC